MTKPNQTEYPNTKNTDDKLAWWVAAHIFRDQQEIPSRAFDHIAYAGLLNNPPSIITHSMGQGSSDNYPLSFMLDERVLCTLKAHQGAHATEISQLLMLANDKRIEVTAGGLLTFEGVYKFPHLDVEYLNIPNYHRSLF